MNLIFKDFLGCNVYDVDDKDVDANSMLSQNEICTRVLCTLVCSSFKKIFLGNFSVLAAGRNILNLNVLPFIKWLNPFVHKKRSLLL